MQLTGPLTLAGVQAPARVVFGPHETNLADGRAIGERHVAYYAERAAGGAGVLVTEVASVTPADWPYERAPLAAECAAGWGAVAAACHPYETVVLAGLGHAGLQGSSAYSQAVLWAPSPVADVVTRELPAVLEPRQIEQLVQDFAVAAEVAVKAGCDGVEFDAATNSLLRQFLSGLTNQREDAYGRNADGRTRFLRDLIASARAAVGPGRVLALRMSCDEDAPWAGITPDQAAATVDAIAADVDLLTVTRGSHYSAAAYRPAGHTAPMFNAELCRAMRTAAAGRTLVVLQGSVVDPAEAQRALDDGVADLVEMTRAQIAEPRLVNLVRAGLPERIRPCVLCNQACQVRDHRNPLVSCAVNPGAGHETTEPAPDGRDDIAQEVLVVGGGPAGLEAARVLAARGHRVRLTEKSDRLGGVYATIAQGSGRARLKGFTDWQAAECRRAGVRISLSTETTTAQLRTAGLVILATGSKAAAGPGISILDVLSGARELPPGAVVLDDPTGGPAAVALAEQLARDGRSDVTVVTPDQLLASRTREAAEVNFRLEALGIRRELRSRIVAPAAHAGSATATIAGPTVTVEHVWTGERHEIPCAALVDCGHRLPEEALFQARPGTPRAGDCVAPRTLLEAVLEGRRVALRAASPTDASRAQQLAMAQARG